MAKAETNVFKGCQLDLSPLGCRLFRNNRGMFLTLDGKRKVRAGLEVPGASDGIGLTVVRITPEMVGMDLAVFTALEAKSGKGGTSGDQNDFIASVVRYCGIAFSAHSGQEAVAKLKLAVQSLQSGNNAT